VDRHLLLDPVGHLVVDPRLRADVGKQLPAVGEVDVEGQQAAEDADEAQRRGVHLAEPEAVPAPPDAARQRAAGGAFDRVAVRGGVHRFFSSFGWTGTRLAACISRESSSMVSLVGGLSIRMAGAPRTPTGAPSG